MIDYMSCEITKELGIDDKVMVINELTETYLENPENKFR